MPTLLGVGGPGGCPSPHLDLSGNAGGKRALPLPGEDAGTGSRGLSDMDELHVLFLELPDKCDRLINLVYFSVPFHMLRTARPCY